MPVFNGARYVGAAIESVLAQSLPDWELVVVDDGSTDGTAAALRPYAADARVTVLAQENRGLARARNRGLSVPAAELVAFLDADDLWTEDHLEAMVGALRSTPDAVLAFAGWQYVDADGALLPQAVMPFHADPAEARRELPWRNAIVPSAVVARLEAVRGVGGFDPRLRACEDWDLWIRLLDAGPFVAVARVSTRYRVHPASMTEDGEAIERERLQVNEKHHGRASGPAATWPEGRRRAVGHTLFVAGLARLRRRDVSAGLRKVREALAVWPGLVEQDEFHFELACAYQPRGVRGTAAGLNVRESAELVRSLLPLPGGRASWGRACLALARMGLVARDRRSARRYAFEALRAIGPRRKGRAVAVIVRTALPCRVPLGGR
jgi:glycosyltransferase involved in cell wall biosynthesis